MSPPVLSVLIPVFNGERYLAETIGSVLAQQNVPALEVIVVDDGSEDNSAAVAGRFPPRVRCIRVPHRGLAAARNTGWDAARGDYLLHLDADDLLPTDSIALRMAEFNGDAAADLVIGHMESFISPDLDVISASRFAASTAPRRGGLPGATVVRAAFAARVGPFDSRRRHSPDLDWMTRAMECDPRFVEIKAVVLQRRIHETNLSHARGDQDTARLAILRAVLERRRAAHP